MIRISIFSLVCPASFLVGLPSDREPRVHQLAIPGVLGRVDVGRQVRANEEIYLGLLGLDPADYKQLVDSGVI